MKDIRESIRKILVEQDVPSVSAAVVFAREYPGSGKVTIYLVTYSEVESEEAKESYYHFVTEDPSGKPELELVKSWEVDADLAQLLEAVEHFWKR